MPRIVSVAVPVAVALVALAGGSAPAAPPPPGPRAAAGPAACTLGTGRAGDLRAARAIIAAEQARFERSLSGVGAGERRTAGSAFATAVAAYLYGFPQVMMQRTIATYPRNTMVAIGKLADTTTVTVVAPNHDTLYSVSQLDLTAGPVVVQTPPTGGRYSVVQLTDVFTDVAGYVGDGPRARTGDTALVVPPGWTGTPPAGMRVIRPASPSLWLLGRTLAAGHADTAAAVELLRRYSVTPLAAYEAGARNAPLVLPDFPKRTPVSAPQGVAFLDELGADLAADPAPARDACAVAAFARAGIGPGRTPSTATGLRGRALRAAAAAGPRALTAYTTAARHAKGMLAGGWTVTPATPRASAPTTSPARSWRRSGSEPTPLRRPCTPRPTATRAGACSAARTTTSCASRRAGCPPSARSGRSRSTTPGSCSTTTPSSASRSAIARRGCAATPTGG